MSGIAKEHLTTRLFPAGTTEAKCHVIIILLILKHVKDDEDGEDDDEGQMWGSDVLLELRLFY